jgi:hypothetical protein
MRPLATLTALLGGIVLGAAAAAGLGVLAAGRGAHPAADADPPTEAAAAGGEAPGRYRVVTHLLGPDRASFHMLLLDAATGRTWEMRATEAGGTVWAPVPRLPGAGGGRPARRGARGGRAPGGAPGVIRPSPVLRVSPRPAAACSGAPAGR